jgi:AcrR family transcriptional regulator
MAKSFTDREREIVRRKLIDSCKECWNRYGYHKTNVRELSTMANISTGAFYQFYASKELLFVDAAQEIELEAKRLIDEAMAQHRNKSGIAEALKAIMRFMSDTPWVADMQSDWEVILRKLPPDFIEQDFMRDMLLIERYTTDFGLKAKLEPAQLALVVNTILMMARNKKLLPGDTNGAIDFIIDAAVDKMFE